MTENPAEAIKNADVIITDVWASMGQEDEAKKRQIAFKGYQVNSEILKLANNDAIFFIVFQLTEKRKLLKRLLKLILM